MSTMTEVMDALGELGPRGVARFQESIDPEWIEQALAATGTASVRRRRFPAEQAVWLVVGAALFADRSIQDIAEHMGLVVPGTPRVAPSAVSQARYRIGQEPIEWLFHKVADAWSCSPGLGAYRGLALFGVDGTHLRVPDTDENYEHFGKPGGRGGSGDAGYPQLRLCALMSLDTRLIVDARFGPWNRSEQDLATELWPALPDNSLTILDRGFVNYRVFARLVASGAERHVMVRMRANMKYQRLELLHDGTELALLRPSSEAVRQEPDVAPTLKVRVIHYQHPGGKPSRLCVTLLDPDMYPANELIALYHERWEIEVAAQEGEPAQQEARGSRAGGLGPAARLQPRASRDAARGGEEQGTSETDQLLDVLAAHQGLLDLRRDDQRAGQHPRAPRRHGGRPPLARPATAQIRAALPPSREDQDEQLREEPGQARAEIDRRSGRITLSERHCG